MLILLKEVIVSYHDDLNILKKEILKIGVEISIFKDSLNQRRI